MKNDLLEYWQAVLQLTVGIALSTDDRQLLRQQLYRARTEAKDLSLEGIVILFPEKEDELWLVRKDFDATSSG